MFAAVTAIDVFLKSFIIIHNYMCSVFSGREDDKSVLLGFTHSWSTASSIPRCVFINLAAS